MKTALLAAVAFVALAIITLGLCAWVDTLPPQHESAFSVYAHIMAFVSAVMSFAVPIEILTTRTHP